VISIAIKRRKLISNKSKINFHIHIAKRKHRLVQITDRSGVGSFGETMRILSGNIIMRGLQTIQSLANTYTRLKSISKYNRSHNTQVSPILNTANYLTTFRVVIAPRCGEKLLFCLRLGAMMRGRMSPAFIEASAAVSGAIIALVQMKREY
jgi:hypothetical protein